MCYGNYKDSYYFKETYNKEKGSKNTTSVKVHIIQKLQWRTGWVGFEKTREFLWAEQSHRIKNGRIQSVRIN